jgi:hypothetical protein
MPKRQRMAGSDLSILAVSDFQHFSFQLFGGCLKITPNEFD